MRVTEIGKEYDTHHLVLDLGCLPFPVLEGQSIGILPPGLDEQGKPHFARQYSVASPRTGERAGYNNLSLTVQRVLQDHQGKPVRGLPANAAAQVYQIGGTDAEARAVLVGLVLVYGEVKIADTTRMHQVGTHKWWHFALGSEVVAGAHPDFEAAIKQFLDREGEGVAAYTTELEERAPFKAV